MQRWSGLEQVPTGYGPSVVTIGNFDGVHRGHVAVLGHLVDEARSREQRSVAVTFQPHPAAVHRPESAPPTITGLTDRLELLASTGLDGVLVVDYTLEFARQSPEDFVLRYLVVPFGATRVIVGRDVRFGRDNTGDLTTLEELGARHGFEVEVVADVGDSAGTSAPQGRWSSTVVRQLLADGDVAAAADVLGHRHRIRGVVVHGDARGRDLGFPTANLTPDADGLVPADGVYAGWLRRTNDAEGVPIVGPDAEPLPAAISIGTNPTFAGLQRRVEAYVLDRTDLDLYDEEVVLEFVERLRGTERFDDVATLIEHMTADVAQVRTVLAQRTDG